MSETRKAHLGFIDGIRGMAILAVFLFHSFRVAFGSDQLEWNGLFRDFSQPTTFLILFPLTYGFAGVPVFFVVSGFCIHLSHSRNMESGWIAFAIRRFFRIYPSYLFALLLFFFVWPWGSLGLSGMERTGQLLTHIFAVHNFNESTLFGINPSFWSIAVEIQLYALYPLLLLFANQVGWKGALITVWSIEFCIRLYSSIITSVSGNSIPVFIEFSPFSFWFSWALGAFLCECHLKNTTSRLFRVRPDLLFIACILFPLFRPTASFTFPAFALLAAVAVERLLKNTWRFSINRVLEKTWSHLCFLGVVSYSFYLIHQPIVGLASRMLRKLYHENMDQPLCRFFLCVALYPVIVFLSFSMFRRIERPFVRFGGACMKKKTEI